MVDIKTPLPAGPSITAPATTNLSATSLAGSRPQVTGTVNNVGSGLKNLLGSVAGSGVLGSAIGVLGNLIGDTIAYKRQQKTYNQQRQDALSDYQMQRQDYLSDLADERAYNSPEAQVARLKAAGINPNTTFGSGSAPNTSSPAENTASMRGAVAASPPSPSGLGNAMIQGASGLIQSSLASVESEQMKSNIELQKAQMLKMLSETRGIDESTKSKMIENGWLDFMFESEINERYQRISESLDRMQSNALQRFSTVYDLNNLKPAQVAHLNAQISSIYQNIASQVQQYKYFESVKDYRAASEKWQSIKAEIDYSTANLENRLLQNRVPLAGGHKGDNFAKNLRNELELWISALSPLKFKF